ncbi:MAG TPA: hypothetical protein VNZ94_00425 [Xanthobacteraceae bacterium]|nr:hypothetical protein [Xanthobacteraceae bacterium]
MTTPQNVSRQPTEPEHAVAADIAQRMVGVIPDGTDPDVLLGATSLITQYLFSKIVKAEFRLEAFDSYAEHCRNVLKRSLT